MAAFAMADSLRELVETAVEGEDIIPLVKLVFESQPASDPLPAPLPRDSESGTTSLGGDPAGGGGGGAALLGGEGALPAVLEVLQEVAEDKEAEIQQMCRSHAVEIASAMHELGPMQRAAGQLRGQLQGANSALQGSGAALLGRLEEVQGILRVQQRVAEARRAVAAATQVLALCVQAAKQIEGRQLYKAYRTLEAVQRDYGHLLYDPGSGAGMPLPLPTREGGAGLSAGAAGAAASGGVGSGRHQPQLGPLAPLLLARVRELTAALEQRAMADVNSWLAGVRAAARTIGLRAVRWAAAERQQEEQLARQRKALLALLGSGGHGAAAATALAAASLAQAAAGADSGCMPGGVAPATPLPLPAGATGSPGRGGVADTQQGSAAPAAGVHTPAAGAAAAGPQRYAAFKAARQQAAGSGSSSPTKGAAAEVAGSPPGTALSTTAGGGRTPAAAAGAAAEQPGSVLRTDSQPGTTGNLLEGVDMSPLHRCVHIHTCLGRLPALASYYASNRRQQLAADLALQGDFLEHYQSFLTQVVGYFLVEDRVAQGAPELAVAAHVDGAWEEAVGRLKALLEPAFRGAAAAPAMLTVKDFLLLVCLALEPCGYHTAAIRELLLSSRARYHDLLSASAGAAVRAALGADALTTPAEVPTEARAAELFRQLALPARFHEEDAALLLPPLRAPFTPLVPEVVRAVRGYVVDSVAYLKGLVTAGEVLPAAKQYRDRLLARVVAEALQQRLKALAAAPGSATAGTAGAAAAGGVPSPAAGAAAAGGLTLPRALLAVADVAALQMGLGAPLDDFAVAQVRGEVPGGEAAAAAAAAAGAARSSSPTPQRSRSRSPSRGAAAPPAAAIDGTAAATTPATDGTAEAGGQLQQQAGQQQEAVGATPAHTVTSVSAAAAAAAAMAAGPSSPPPPAGVGAAGGGGGGGVGAAAMQAVLESAEALAVQVVAAKARRILAAGEALDWAPEAQQRAVGGYSPYVEELIMHLKECQSAMARAVPRGSVDRMVRAAYRQVADALMLQLVSDAIPTLNIFGLTRLLQDLGGLAAAAGAAGVPALPDELAEPTLLCELVVFGGLEELLRPEARAGRLAPLNLRRVVVVLGKYRELERGSGFASMHRGKQAAPERFTSRRTVDRVLRELRDLMRSGSPGGSPSGGSAAGSARRA